MKLLGKIFAGFNESNEKVFETLDLETRLIDGKEHLVNKTTGQIMPFTKNTSVEEVVNILGPTRPKSS